MTTVIDRFEGAVRDYYEAYGLGYPKHVQASRKAALNRARSDLLEAFSPEAKQALLNDLFGQAASKPAAVAVGDKSRAEKP